MMDIMYLRSLIINCIIYIEIYKMSISLLLFNNKVKVKVFSWLKYVPFVDVLHRRGGENPLRPLQWIPQTIKCFLHEIDVILTFNIFVYYKQVFALLKDIFSYKSNFYLIDIYLKDIS